MVLMRFERAEAGGSKVHGAKLRLSCRGVSGSGGSDDRAELGGRPKDENGSKVGRGLGKGQVNNGVGGDLWDGLVVMHSQSLARAPRR